MVTSVVSIARDEHRLVLLTHKTDDNLWALPGGMRLVSRSSDVVIREVKEEAGDEVETISGTHTNPRHVKAYNDGEVRQPSSIASRARRLGGEGRGGTEEQRNQRGFLGAA